MESIKGYRYTNEQYAVNARDACDAYYGIPKSPTDVTQHWVDYNYAELDGFWYITYDESLIPILGEPTEFEVTQPDETN
jgi:hypothetical protein